MATSRITSDSDWTFGQGLANYARGSEEVAQNVKTRIKMFKNDWFLDVDDGIDWFNILGNKNNINTITNEIERVAGDTDGVRSIINIELKLVGQSRDATVIIEYVDVFQNSFQLEIGIN